MDGSYHTGAGGVDRAGNLGGPPARPGRKTPHISANRAFPSNQAVRVDGVYIRVVKYVTQSTNASAAQIVDALVYSQILIAAQNPSGQLFAASEKPRRDLVPESNMLFIGAAASRGKSARYIRPYGECTDADPCWCQMDPGAACARFYAWAAPQTRTVGPSRAPI